MWETVIRQWYSQQKNSKFMCNEEICLNILEENERKLWKRLFWEIHVLFKFVFLTTHINIIEHYYSKIGGSLSTSNWFHWLIVFLVFLKTKTSSFFKCLKHYLEEPADSLEDRILFLLFGIVSHSVLQLLVIVSTVLKIIHYIFFYFNNL